MLRLATSQLVFVMVTWKCIYMILLATCLRINASASGWQRRRHK